MEAVDVDGILLGCALALLLSCSPGPDRAGRSAAETLTLEAFQKLKSITQGAKPADLIPSIVAALGIGDGGAVSAKQFRPTRPLAYVLTIMVKPATDDVVFTFRDLAGVTYNYLSDSNRKLRKATVTDLDGTRPVPNDQADKGFQDSLKAWEIVARRVKLP